MEFASRYELEDPLLTTAVETFGATDRQSQQRVLVHVFPAADHGLTSSSSPDEVEQRFAALTGARVAVRHAGVDPVTGYAYAVTDEIEKEVIAGWGSGSEPATTSGASTERFNTAEFLNPMAGTPGEPKSVAESVPGAFTREFMPVRAAPSQPGANTPPSSAPVRGPGAFTRMFFGDPSCAGTGASTPDRAAAGGDTVQLLPETPPPMSSRPQPGTFTRIFGQPGTPVAREPQPPQPGPFTRMFQESAGPTATAPAKPTPSDPPAPTYQHPKPATPAEPRSAPVAPAPVPPRAPATQFFSEDRARAPQPVLRAGPSEYTRVVSATFAEPRPVTPAAPAPESTAPPAPALGVPSANAHQPPPVHGYPGMPAYQPPQVPPYAAPAPPPYAAPVPPPHPALAPAPYGVPAPPAPKPAAAPQAAPSRSWMPFIILVNVLFLIAILLIVVFALKGH